MGRGRTPTPTAILKARGSYRADRHGKKGEVVEPPPELPACPEHLDAVARSTWARLAADLYALGVLTSIDVGILATYCAVYSRWVEAEVRLRADGFMLTGKKNGKVYQNPYLAVVNRFVDQLTKLGAELGLSPAARTRVRIPPPKPPGEFSLERFMMKPVLKIAK